MKARAFSRLIALVALLVVLLTTASVDANSDSMCSDIPASECNALVAFYNATGGSAWKNNTNWLTDTHVCFHWYGVQCWNGHVFRLDLRQNGLTGTIPTALTGLPYLDTLYLWGNQLQGSIPPELGNLTKLRWLALSENPLGGQIPSSFGNLRALEDLSLSSCNLSGPIPDSIGNLSSLKGLRAWGNQLSGPMPATFENLTALRELSLEQNQINGPLPAFLGDLSSLQDLGLSDNDFDGAIPSTLGNLTNLTSLNLKGNELSGPIPATLGNLTNLTKLDLGSNGLSDSIPGTLGNLTNLTELHLGGNDLSGSIPSTLGNLTHLAYLNLFDNNLSGHIPPELGNLSQLEEFYAGSNELDGPIPASLGNLTALRVLRLPDNQLSDALPSSLGELTNLTELSLFGNKGDGGSGLLGPIPASLGNLSKLKVLNLSGNSLTHEIPHSLFQLPELTTLQLSDNLLEGDLPAPGAAMAGDVSGAAAGSKLVVLDVSYNRLTGIKLNWGAGTPVRSVSLRGNQIKQSIPAALFKIPTLEFIDLGENQLEGHIPDVAALVNLKILKLDHNGLTGGIPINIDALHNLEVLNLSYNHLDRAMVLPLTSALPKLYRLDLSHNHIPSQIPGELRLLTGLKILNLGSNLLEGPIPDLSGMQFLEELDMSYNDLTGGVPQYLPLLTNLKTLSLSGNANLRGFMPATIGSLKRLEVLQMNGIGLGGNVPDSLATLTNLRVLDLGGENFAGGTFTKKIGNLTRLEYLDLEQGAAGLTGLSNVPFSELVKLKKLRICQLRHTVDGFLTSGIGDLTQLQILDVWSQRLRGSLPKEIGRLTGLEELGVCVNTETAEQGKVPDELGSLSALRILDMSGSTAKGGKLPTTLGNLSSLESLDLEGAFFDFGDPSWLGMLHNLKSLNLSRTSAGEHGTTLNWLASLAGLVTADLSYADLDGPLPSLQALTKLTHLNLGHNRHIQLPPNFGAAASLQYLDLSYNDRVGALPADIFKMINLKALNLKQAGLTGTLPEGICQLDDLQSLDVSLNGDLTGPIPHCVMYLHNLRNPQFWGTDLCYWGDRAFQNWMFWSGAKVDTSQQKCSASAVSAQIGPSGGTLSSESDNTTYTFAPGTFGGTAAVASTATITVTHVPKDAGNAPATGALVGIRHFYDAYARDAGGQYVQPVKPYTVTIQYGPLDLVSGQALESSLALYRWNGTSWVKEPTSRVDAATDTITANPARFSTWAVLGQRAPARRRLPLMMKGVSEE